MRHRTNRNWLLRNWLRRQTWGEHVGRHMGYGWWPGSMCKHTCHAQTLHLNHRSLLNSKSLLKILHSQCLLRTTASSLRSRMANGFIVIFYKDHFLLFVSISSKFVLETKTNKHCIFTIFSAKFLLSCHLKSFCHKEMLKK
jgi:hypothetical protein